MVDGAAEPVTVSTPVSLAGDSEEIESVLGCGGMTIVSDACDEGTADAEAEAKAGAEELDVSEAEVEGGNGEARIEDRPLEMSAPVMVLWVMVASVTVVARAMDNPASVLIGIEVKPGSTVSVSVTLNEDALDVLVVVELGDVLSAIELSPLTMLSEAVCTAPVPFDWFCCAVSLSVVYPLVGPLKVGEAVTKTMVMLLGDDALDSVVSTDAEVLIEAVEEDGSELGSELLEAAALARLASTSDVELLAVAEGVDAAVSCTVVSTVTMFVVCEYTVTTSGCAVCNSETAADDALTAAKAGIGTTCVETGSDVDDGAATAPVPSCLFRMLMLWSLTTHLLCSSLARRRMFLLLLLSTGPAEVRAARRSKPACEICIFAV